MMVTAECVYITLNFESFQTVIMSEGMLRKFILNTLSFCCFTQAASQPKSFRNKRLGKIAQSKFVRHRILILADLIRKRRRQDTLLPFVAIYNSHIKIDLGLGEVIDSC